MQCEETRVAHTHALTMLLIRTTQNMNLLGLAGNVENSLPNTLGYWQVGNVNVLDISSVNRHSEDGNLCPFCRLDSALLQSSSISEF